MFNIFLRPKEAISPESRVVPDSMSNNIMMATGVALHSKFSQSDNMVAKYKDAHKLIDTMTNGYVFLQLLLELAQILLAIKNIATVDIQKIKLLLKSL